MLRNRHRNGQYYNRDTFPRRIILLLNCLLVIDVDKGVETINVLRGYLDRQHSSDICFLVSKR